jgi:two-component system, chemotaxis family, sensor kinase CheA
MLNDIRVAFALESTQTLNGMEEAILALEQGAEDALGQLFRHAHTLKGSAGIVGMKRLESYAHMLEHRLSAFREGGKAADKALCDALLACKDRCGAILAEEPITMGDEDEAGDEVMTEATLSAEDELSIHTLDTALGIEAEAERAPESAYRELDRKTVPELYQGGVRVPDAKLDALVNLVGELVTVQAQFTRMASDSADRSMQGLSETLKRLVGDLRTASMDMRLMPADNLFSKFQRLTRDLASELHKEVELLISGGNTELDKSVIEGLAEPMLHIIRNAMDHGIEEPEARLKAGKSRRGKLRINASHEGASVRIRVSDDGRGIDCERVLRKAMERALLPQNAKPSKEDILTLLFLPNFSTSDTVSTVSGRGYGLDIVKAAVERLGGEIHVESELGRGTDFIIDIPLTIAIIDGFLARIDDRLFILPLANIAECYERPRPDPGLRERLIERNGEFIPAISLEQTFGIERGSEPSTGQEMVIATAYGAKIALGFDKLLGGYQTVIKPLGELAGHLAGISGSAILPDGAVALILDVGSLSRLAK